MQANKRCDAAVAREILLVLLLLLLYLLMTNIALRFRFPLQEVLKLKSSSELGGA